MHVSQLSAVCLLAWSLAWYAPVCVIVCHCGIRVDLNVGISSLMQATQLSRSIQQLMHDHLYLAGPWIPCGIC